ncbi:MAG: hypothetical protein COB38_09255 [Gammaproteobacteria bacterium]|nr:MAG: hypothetical protein COB38_09255 [Gammaproteobacteria bacterium]
MQYQIQTNLVRKQFLISESNIEKLNRIATQDNISAANVVRLAIEAYNPSENIDQPELMELVSSRLKEAISSTQKANQKISKILEKPSPQDMN